MADPNPGRADLTSADVEQRLSATLRHSLQPSPEQMLALHAGALTSAEASRVRQQLLQSPAALADYAEISGQTLAEVQAALAAPATWLSALVGLVSTTHTTLRRLAEQLQMPQNNLQFRGDAPITLAFEISGEPAATLLIEQTQAALRRYRITGQLIFDDAALPQSGEFQLTRTDGVPMSAGEVSDTGTFDCGTLSSGLYKLEIVIGENLIEVHTLQVDDNA